MCYVLQESQVMEAQKLSLREDLIMLMFELCQDLIDKHGLF